MGAEEGEGRDDQAGLTLGPPTTGEGKQLHSVKRGSPSRLRWDHTGGAACARETCKWCSSEAEQGR